MTKAPKCFCGCKHQAMFDMVNLTGKNIEVCTIEGGEMYGFQCIGKDFPNGPMSIKHWPKNKVTGDYGVYCSYVTRIEYTENQKEDNRVYLFLVISV